LADVNPPKPPPMIKTCFGVAINYRDFIGF
jgi:hypothetical protein